MDIVLVHPTIPWNTGNVGRTCVATNTKLHLVEPMGFDLSDKQLKRAGLDYWQHLDVTTYPSLEDFMSKHQGRTKFLFSRFATKSYTDASYPSDAMLVFGSETSGLPEDFKSAHQETTLVIPSPGPVRSLNLSTSAAIVLFEAIRQNL